MLFISNRKLTYFSLLILSFFCVHARCMTPQDTLYLKVDDAIKIALSESPLIKIANQEVELKRQGRKEVAGKLMPELNWVSSYSRAIKKQTMAMTLPEGTNTIKVGMDNSYNSGVDLNLPIFAPALYRSMKLSSQDIVLALEKYRASKVDLINEVTKSFLQVLLAQDSYRVLQKSYDQAQVNFSIVLNKFNAGLVSEYDKIRADVQVRNLKPAVVSSQNAIRLSIMQLRVVIGLSDDVQVAAIGGLKDYESELATDTFKKLYSQRSINLTSNTDLRQIDISEKISEQSIKLEKTNFMPSISASLNYSYVCLSDDFNMKYYQWNPTSVFGVTLVVPLFNASNLPRVKQARIQLAQLQQNKINLQRQLYMQANSYLDNMMASVEQIDSNAEGVKEADKGREIARKMYEVGRGTILDLNDSEVAYTQAELAYNQSIYDYVVAKSEYNRIIGIDDLGFTNQENN